MIALGIIIGISWVIFWIYWFWAAARTGIALGSRTGRGNRIAFLLVAIIIFRVFAKILHLGQENFHHQPAVKAVGLILFYGGLVLAIWARRHIGASWGIPMSVRSHPKLITSGPYRFIRHPIYSGLLLAALGCVLALSRIWIIIFVVTAIYWIFSAVQEEKMLTKQLPQEYPAYKRRSKMLIPYFF